MSDMLFTYTNNTDNQTNTNETSSQHNNNKRLDYFSAVHISTL